MTQSADLKALDFSRVSDDAWTLAEVTPDYRRYRIYFEDGSYAQKTEYLADEELIAINQNDLNDSYGKRFGDGKVVARIPMNVLYDPNQEFMKNLQQGDTDFVKWWLNHEKARPYRSFRGTL